MMLTDAVASGVGAVEGGLRPRKVVATIEARMGSTRLPGKVLLPVLGRPLLSLMIERVRRARRLDEIVIATTENPAGDAIVDLARLLGVEVFRGSEEDVLDRVLRAARAASADVTVELTGDCPLMDPGIIDRVVEEYLHYSFDYVGNGLRSTFPLGFGVQVFATAVLEKVEHLTKDPVDREHVSLYIYEHPDLFTLHNVESGLPEKYHALRLCVDTSEDFALVKAVFEGLYPSNPEFGLHEILDFLDGRPELLRLNQHVRQKSVR